MSLKQLDRIDAIGIDKNSGDVVVSIIDDLEWNDVDDHISLLIRKVEAYLGFLEKGDIYTSYPDAEGKNILLKVYIQYPPGEKGKLRLDDLSRRVFDRGFRLIYQRV